MTGVPESVTQQPGEAVKDEDGIFHSLTNLVPLYLWSEVFPVESHFSIRLDGHTL